MLQNKNRLWGIYPDELEPKEAPLFRDFSCQKVLLFLPSLFQPETFYLCEFCKFLTRERSSRLWDEDDDLNLDLTRENLKACLRFHCEKGRLNMSIDRSYCGHGPNYTRGPPHGAFFLLLLCFCITRDPSGSVLVGVMAQQQPRCKLSPL